VEYTGSAAAAGTRSDKSDALSYATTAARSLLGEVQR
jgi:hypothetical protein